MLYSRITHDTFSVNRNALFARSLALLMICLKCSTIYYDLIANFIITSALFHVLRYGHMCSYMPHTVRQCLLDDLSRHHGGPTRLIKKYRRIIQLSTNIGYSSSTLFLVQTYIFWPILQIGHIHLDA